MFALAVSGQYPCVRVGKIAVATYPRIIHACHALKRPPQYEERYHSLDIFPCESMEQMARRIEEHPAEVIVVHNEPNWPVVAAKQGARGRRVIYAVHDITSAREGEPIDAWERQAYDVADALLFVTAEQREFAIARGFDVEGKPWAALPNYATRDQFIDESPFPHIGGVVYAGGAHQRSGGKYWRDMSPIADVIDAFHIYCATGEHLDYGIYHRPEANYQRLIYRLAAHDWCMAGIPIPHEGYNHAIPNKPFDAFAAGIPIIVMNAPLLKPICERGLGIYCETYEDVREAANTDPAPYREKVLELRDEYTIEAHVDELFDLYEGAKRC